MTTHEPNKKAHAGFAMIFLRVILHFLLFVALLVAGLFMGAFSFLGIGKERMQSLLEKMAQAKGQGLGEEVTNKPSGD